MKSNQLAIIVLAISPENFDQGPWGRVVKRLNASKPSLRIGLVGIGQRGAAHESAYEGSEFIDRLNICSFSEPKSSASLGSYSDFLLSPGYQQFRFVSLKMLNRIDLTGTFRFLEREVYLQSAVLNALTLLLDRKPDLVMFDVTPHEFLPFVFQSVAEWLGIRVLFFQPCSMAPAMIARTSLRRVIAPEGATVVASPLSDAIRRFVPQRLKLLVDGLDPIYMQQQRARDRTVSSRLHLLKSVPATLSWLLKDRFPQSRDFTGHDRRHGVLVRFAKIMLSQSLQSSLRERANALGSRPLPQAGYCVLALHYEPERTSLPDGLPVDFQGDAVAHSRAIIPLAKTLVLKEHYLQQSSAGRGFVGRSPDFYDLVESMPNTQFAPTHSRLSELISGAECVFTLTGTVAIEAVLRGIPVAYFGSPWWEGLPGTVRVASNLSYEEICGLQLPTQEDVSNFLDDLCGTAMIPGLASERIISVESRLGPLPQGFFDAVANSISLCVLHELERD